MAHKIDWCVVYETAIAMAEPKLSPSFTTVFFLMIVFPWSLAIV
jgi:hypothetical protein